MSTASATSLRVTSRGDILSADPRIIEVLETVDLVARSLCTVLVTGESGTGKELIVAALHDASNRRSGPLVTINCGAIPNELVESELFGHAKGAFTGAQGARRGLVSAAEGGTLFLDEVGDLPLAVQVKLLRLLQQREYTPLGDTRAVKCDVRIAAATNRDLEAAVKAGRFREDLFYRLNVIHLELPPLRERRNDLELLAQHFCRLLIERTGREDLEGLSPAALDAIEAHSWPGNIRALENAIERGVLLARGPFVEPSDIFGRKASGRPSVPADGAARATSASASDIGPSASTPSSDVEERPAAVAGFREKTHALPGIETAANAGGTALPDPSSPHPSDGPVRRVSNPMFPRVLPEVGIELFNAIDNYQNDLIRQALARTAGNRNRAAQLLGVNRTTLVEMIKRRKL